MLRSVLLMTLCLCVDLSLLSFIRDVLHDFLVGSTKMHKKYLNQATVKERITMSFVEQYVAEKKNQKEVNCFKRYYWLYRAALIMLPVKYAVTIALVLCGNLKIAKIICLSTMALLALIATAEQNANRNTPHRDRNYRRK